MKKYLFLLSILITLDLFLKYLAVNFLPLGGNYLFKNWLGLELFLNKYIAFSIPIPLFLLYILNTIIIFIIIYIFYKKLKVDDIIVQYQRLAIIILLAGALGNFIDRIYNGYVIDYIVIGRFPVFNLADILVFTGTFFWLGLEYFQEYKKGSRSSTDRTIPS